MSKLAEATKGHENLVPGTAPLLSCIHWAGLTGTTNSKVSHLALDFLTESVQVSWLIGVIDLDYQLSAQFLLMLAHKNII